ncbi:MAG: hypothetical protein H0V49_03825 [Nocardioidaceae bacterium]|nr:hypothetical protein [Nocardioidaceae bacterium]
MRQVAVPWGRVEGWVGRFEAQHPGAAWTVSPEAVHATCSDGTTATWAIPFADQAEVRTLPELWSHLERPWQLGVILVRRGGFAVAHVIGSEVRETKVGKRHVQGKTKAGGWSQQRFARRRDNQARVAFDAAADHVHAILTPHAGRLDLLGTGGDRAAVAHVLSDPRLARVASRPQRWLGGVADPRRDVLIRAIETTRSVTITVTDPPSR